MKYITTPIYYLNGNPHIGHAFTTILSDVLKRLAVIKGEECFLTTGADEHGQKNQLSIEKSGLSVEQFLQERSDNYKDLFNKLNIKYDYFVRTSAEKHKKVVKKCLEIIKEKNLIIKKSYTGLYCEGCEQFKKLTDLDENGLCPDHKKAPQEITEENYFFKLEPFRQWLIRFIEQNPDWIQPKVFAGEILAMLQEPLEDLCISRPKSRVYLGIEFPFDTDYVTYIWFDALINYLSSLDWPNNNNFHSYWDNSLHIMGKDIIKAHCIYWPIMLKALDLELVKNVFVHGFWLGEGNVKMSKTIGNVVDPVEVLNLVGRDPLRFYLCNTMNGAKDGQVSINLIKNTYNLLGNNIGNLHSRSCKMIEKYCGGKIPEVSILDNDKLLLKTIAENFKNKISQFQNFETIQELTQLILNAGNNLNLFIDQKEPWKLAKDINNKAILESCLYTLIEGLRLIAYALNPLMPDISNKMLKTINIENKTITISDFNVGLLKSGTNINEVEMLFPRIN